MDKDCLKMIIYDILLLILTGAGFFVGGHAVYLVLVSGVLMILSSYSFYTDNKLLLARIPITVCFAILTGGWFGFLAFMCLDNLRRELRLLACVVGFAFFGIINRNIDTPVLIVDMIILAICSLMLWLMENILDRIASAKSDSYNSFRQSAINEMHSKLLNKELIRTRYLSEKNARLLEREEISRNIHNSVGHSITAAIMTLDAADMLYDKKPEEARNKMNQANERMRGGLESIRRAVRVLDSETKDVSVADLKESLLSIADEFMMDRSVVVYIDCDEQIMSNVMEHEHFEFLTGAFKELLTNGEKHGKATEYVFALSGDSAHIRLDYRDNGKSDFSSGNSEYRIEKGFGLKKMQSYVKRCGGAMSCDNDNGFHVVLELLVNGGRSVE